jgi:transcriptional regulator with XRE-family HTH domain
MFLKTNLKWLRKRKNRTQEEVAFALAMKRATYSGYETGVGEPSLEKLLTIARYFRITLDGLVKTDLRTISEREYQELLQADNFKWEQKAAGSNN